MFPNLASMRGDSHSNLSSNRHDDSGMLEGDTTSTQSRRIGQLGESTMDRAPGISPRNSALQRASGWGAPWAAINSRRLPSVADALSSSGVFSSDIRQSRQASAHRSEYPDSDENEEDVGPNPASKRFIVGLDYGTTFTSVAYFVHESNEENPKPFHFDVKSISNWPNGGILGSRKQVPTEVWYSSVPAKPSRTKREPNYYAGDMSDSEDDDYMGDRGSASALRNPRRIIDTTDDESVYDDDESNKLLWGYAVPYQQYTANTGRSPSGLVKCAKSKLLDTEYTQNDRTNLDPIIAELIRNKHIDKAAAEPSDAANVEDIITHFLTEVFKHAKSQLILYEKLTDDCPVQFVMTVPTIWSSRSSRILQSAMEGAILKSGFGKLGNGCVDNLFIIAEPEAAATFVMARTRNMLPRETFVLLDCGGGTVDGITYTVTSSYPLRLKKEEVDPDGDNCGASYLNENYKTLLNDRLRDETYLFTNGETKESIVNRLIPKFEDDFKRRVDVTKGCAGRVYIANLIGAEHLRFENNKLKLNQQDFQRIFIPILDRVEQVLRKQIELAWAKGKTVKKVYLVGGFGEAPSLRSWVQRYLTDLSENLDYKIKLEVLEEGDSVTAVARGAVLRALNKENGPDRIAQCSYGFLRTEPYEPDEIPEHNEATAFRSEVDGEFYVKTIKYFMIKGETITSNHVFPPFPTYQIFPTTKATLLCEDELYISDTATESHYELKHPKNADVEFAGRVEMDMTRLRDDKIIKVIRPQPGSRAKSHYRVDYELLAMVYGRNLKYAARYPAGRDGDPETEKVKQISIAAAFKPGTN